MVSVIVLSFVVIGLRTTSDYEEARWPPDRSRAALRQKAQRATSYTTPWDATDAGHSLPAEKLRHLRTFASKWVQLVEMRKRFLAQIRAHKKFGTAAMFDDIDTDLKAQLDTRIRELEDRIEATISSDENLSETATFLRSIPGIGPGASTMLIAEMPELGTITGEQAAALAGLAPVAHDSGTRRGKRAIAGGRRALRHVMFQAAIVAAHHNPSINPFAARLRKAGKPHKVIITAVARKLITFANALCRKRSKWTPSAP